MAVSEAIVGVVPISQVANRQRCKVSGKIRSIAIGVPGQAEGFELDLFDESGWLRAVWQGQRQIPGLVTGREMVVEGLATMGRQGYLTMLNPRYELLPEQGSS
ncbi:MAG: DNA-binding protein [Micrococcales bacterium]|nr:DNA-binding protein [Micrococcales bacterium]